MADIKKEYERWLENATADADVATELKTLDDSGNRICSGCGRCRRILLFLHL